MRGERGGHNNNVIHSYDRPKGCQVMLASLVCFLGRGPSV